MYDVQSGNCALFAEPHILRLRVIVGAARMFQGDRSNPKLLPMCRWASPSARRPEIVCPGHTPADWP